MHGSAPISPPRVSPSDRRDGSLAPRSSACMAQWGCGWRDWWGCHASHSHTHKHTRTHAHLTLVSTAGEGGGAAQKGGGRAGSDNTLSCCSWNRVRRPTFILLHCMSDMSRAKRFKRVARVAYNVCASHGIDLTNQTRSCQGTRTPPNTSG